MKINKNYGQRLTTRIRSDGFLTVAAMTAIVLLLSLTITTPSFAAPQYIGNTEAADLLGKCLLYDDMYEAVSDTNDAGWNGCCSKKLGWCIECPNTTGSAALDRKRKCIKYPAPIMSPGTGISAPGGEVMAPTKPKRQLPTNIWNAQTAPAATAPTKDVPKKSWPSTTVTKEMAPLKLYKTEPNKQNKKKIKGTRR